MKFFRLISLLTAALLLSGCAAGEPQETSEAKESVFFAMDTVMSLTVYGDEHLLDDAQQCVEELEAKLSVTDEGSEIYALNHSGSARLSQDSARLLSQSLELCRRTQGALDLSIYPVVRAWGFTTGEYGIPEEETLQELLEQVDYRAIGFDEADGRAVLCSGMEIDLGSVAKGYTGDRLIELLEGAGVVSALVNLGGNVQALGAKPDGSPWRIAVQDPFGEGYLGVLEVENQAVITSGGYERYFEENGQIYWHIIDPASGAPAHSGLVSVTVVGDSGVTCDGLSTALFIMGREKAEQLWRASDDFEMILVGEDGGIVLTEGLQERFSPVGTDFGEIEVIRRG